MGPFSSPRPNAPLQQKEHTRISLSLPSWQQMPSRTASGGGMELPENVGSTGTIEIKKEDKHSCSLEVLDGSTHA